MSRRPSILFVSARLPQPLATGTNIRIRHMLSALTAVGDVHVVAYGDGNEIEDFKASKPASEAWWTECVSIRAVPAPGWPVSDSEACYSRLMKLKPFASVPHFFATFPGELLRRLVSSMQPAADLVWVERLYVAQQLAVPAHKCIVDIDDLESVKVGRGADIAEGRYTRWAMRREVARLAAFEARAIDRLARLAVCSKVDAERWGSASDRVWVVPNGTDDELFERPREAAVPGRLVFVGTMSYWPNEDAVLYFVDEILPRIAERIPNVSLAVVGRAPPDRIRRLHDGHRVCVHADVADVAPFVQRAALSVVPLRAGGGTRLKIIESLALGTPVVSTTIGAEGLDFRDGQEILLADDPGAFADAVSRLLANQEERRRMAADGARRAGEVYRWSQIRRKLGQHVEEFIQAQDSTVTSPAP